MKEFILDSLAEVQNGYSLCGIVDKRGRVFSLNLDTKVISILFEIVARQAVIKYANQEGLVLMEAKKQNHYPDFTLMRDQNDQEKIAIDVKTTYRRAGQIRFKFAMGSYTSYIHQKWLIHLSTHVKMLCMRERPLRVGFAGVRTRRRRGLASDSGASAPVSGDFQDSGRSPPLRRTPDQARPPTMSL